MSERVRLERHDRLATLTVDHPPVNALGNETIDALTEAVRLVAADEQTRAVVLTGAGTTAFLAGADLAEFSEKLGDRAWIEDHTLRSRALFEALANLPQPLIGAVQASALGGGLEVALMCDLVVSDPKARFGLPEVRLGLMPGAGGTQRLPRKIGLGPATELIMLGRTIDAAEAQRLGLVHQIANAGSTLAEATTLAAKLAVGSQTALRAIKRSLSATTLPLEDGLGRERELFIDLFERDDAREGVSAFLEKRAPAF